MVRTFNLSPSSLTTYLNSPLEFYFTYIEKAPPDTKPYTCYGNAGNVVHDALDIYAKTKDFKKAEEFFKNSWRDKKLYTDPDMKGNPLDINDYYRAFLKGVDVIDNKYDVVASEETIVIPLLKDYRGFTINKKGIIDLQCFLKGSKELIICDYKTSNSVDNDEETFKRQALFYAHLIYVKKGVFVKKAIFEYLKINEVKEYNYTFEEVYKFGDYLEIIAREIVDKADDMSKFEVGKWKTPFNVHRKKCMEEEMNRYVSKRINILLKDNVMFFPQGLPDKILSIVDKYFSYKVDNAYHITAVKKGVWDGVKKLYKKDTLPYGFYHKFVEIVDEVNKVYNENYKIYLTDARHDGVVGVKYDTVFDTPKIPLRDYQEEAIKVALVKKILIIYIGTAGGKTLISAELIKRINQRTLYIVNRIELSTQTKEEYEEYLGVEIGLMTEGNLDVDNQITVSSIQTICAILKRNDATSRELRKFLFNVTVTIMEECQNVKDAGMYSLLSNELKNNEYMIGLSGSPFRNGNDTLEMNALVGFPMYRKTTKELEQEGYICPTECYFLQVPHREGGEVEASYHENYNFHIVNNDFRNKMVVEVCQEFVDRDKKVMVVVNRIEHGEILQDLIPNSFFIHGSTNRKERRDIYERFKNNDDIVLISMVKIVGTGINIPDLDAVIVASAHKSDIDTIQIPGRVKRKSEFKEVGFVVDFYDKTKSFVGFSKQRIKTLLDGGNKVYMLNKPTDLNFR